MFLLCLSVHRGGGRSCPTKFPILPPDVRYDGGFVPSHIVLDFVTRCQVQVGGTPEPKFPPPL